jgi:hypothetical protein
MAAPLRDLATFSAVLPRLDRGIQYAAPVVVRASSLTPAAGILGHPVRPGDDKR